MMPLRPRNPYWDTLRDNTGIPADATTIDWTRIGPSRALPAYRELCSFRYAMTISDPATVRFIADYAGGQLVDPFAGTGYWAYLLQQAGIDVLASDVRPPERTWTPVAADSAAAAVADTADRTLLLSWPPYGRPIGARVLRAYPGTRVIYLGEGFGGCCGTNRMFELLRTEWTEIAEHRPVQWPGSLDYVTVYDRPPLTGTDSPPAPRRR
jgi:hypothetical protein